MNFHSLYDYFIDDDEETEWQHYLRASIETILRVSDVLPEEVLRIVVSCNKLELQKKSIYQILWILMSRKYNLIITFL